MSKTPESKTCLSPYPYEEQRKQLRQGISKIRLVLGTRIVTVFRFAWWWRVPNLAAGCTTTHLRPALLQGRKKLLPGRQAGERLLLRRQWFLGRRRDEWSCKDRYSRISFHDMEVSLLRVIHLSVGYGNRSTCALHF